MMRLSCANVVRKEITIICTCCLNSTEVGYNSYAAEELIIKVNVFVTVAYALKSLDC